jgi:hypothetical protein
MGKTIHFAAATTIEQTGRESYEKWVRNSLARAGKFQFGKFSARGQGDKLEIQSFRKKFFMHESVNYERKWAESRK